MTKTGPTLPTSSTTQEGESIVCHVLDIWGWEKNRNELETSHEVSHTNILLGN